MANNTHGSAAPPSEFLSSSLLNPPPANMPAPGSPQWTCGRPRRRVGSTLAFARDCKEGLLVIVGSGRRLGALSLTEGGDLTEAHYILIGISAFTVVAIALLVVLWLRKYRALMRTIQNLQRTGCFVNVPPSDAPTPHSTSLDTLEEDPVQTGQQTPAERQKSKSLSRSIWRPPQPGPRFTKADLNLMQIIKAGKEGVFYKARMNRGTCKGHSFFTCKISKEGVSPKRVETEVSIMRKLGHHKNVLQLLDWNTSQVTTVCLGLSCHDDCSHLLILCVVPCNILSFPRKPNQQIEQKLNIMKLYFALCFLGTLPYPNLETSEEVVFHICSGNRMRIPETCRPEIMQMMEDCWLEPYTRRPSFSDIIGILENILENDADYVDVDNKRLLPTVTGASGD
nr:PREDICTED: uncharacterized protein LOC107079903 [Lepisosteus oculatus]